MSSEVKIEKGLPLPKIKVEKGIPLPSSYGKYPFSKMEVGDSFKWPLECRARLNTAAANYAKSHDMRFTIRAISPRELRIWRTK